MYVYFFRTAMSINRYQRRRTASRLRIVRGTGFWRGSSSGCTRALQWRPRRTALLAIYSDGSSCSFFFPQKRCTATGRWTLSAVEPSSPHYHRRRPLLIHSSFFPLSTQVSLLIPRVDGSAPSRFHFSGRDWFLFQSLVISMLNSQ